MRTKIVSAVLTFVAAVAPLTGAAQPAAPALTLTRELRVDGNERSIGRIGFVDVAPDGRIAYGDLQAETVTFLSPTGALLGTFGRRGQGPGDFGGVFRGAFVGDTLWVYDSPQHQLTLVSPARTMIRSIRVAQQPSFPPCVTTCAVSRDGSMLVMGPVVEGKPQAVLRAPRPGPEASAIDLASPSVRRIAELPPDSSYVSYRAANGTTPLLAVPFVARPLVDFSGDGSRVAYATTTIDGPRAGSIRVTVLGATGATVYSRAYPFTLVPIPKAVVDSAREATKNPPIRGRPGAAPVQTRSNTDPGRDAAVDGLKIAPAYPPLTSIQVGRDGSVWLALHATDSATPYLVLDPTGEPYGRFVLPPNQTLSAADLHNAWGYERDQNDVESIVRWRVDRGR